jgi:hypothetical protein
MFSDPLVSVHWIDELEERRGEEESLKLSETNEFLVFLGRKRINFSAASGTLSLTLEAQDFVCSLLAPSDLFSHFLSYLSCKGVVTARNQSTCDRQRMILLV